MNDFDALSSSYYSSRHPHTPRQTHNTIAYFPTHIHVLHHSLQYQTISLITSKCQLSSLSPVECSIPT